MKWFILRSEDICCLSFGRSSLLSRTKRCYFGDRWAKYEGLCDYLNARGSKRLQSDCINNIKLLNLKYVIKHCVFELSEFESNNIPESRILEIKKKSADQTSVLG